MAGDCFGKVFEVCSWGESHGQAVGVVISGCPPGIPLKEGNFDKDMERRRPGQNSLVSQRREADKVRIVSGVFNGKTTGTPILLVVANKDANPKDYKTLRQLYRPSHADFVYERKYGVRDPYGGGRSSARVLAGHVAAGVVAKQILKQQGTNILGYVKSVHTIENSLPVEAITFGKVERSPVRCPDKTASAAIEELIRSVQRSGDSVGGVVECLIQNCPVGLGEPVFDKLEADLAKACLGINACKGFEIGSGLAGTKMFGSEHNDPFVADNNKIQTKTNHSGGIQGGISNGMPIVFRAAFKPTSTLFRQQKTLTSDKKSIRYKPKGRHDPCVVPRAVPIVEAIAAIVLCDHLLRSRMLNPPT